MTRNAVLHQNVDVRLPIAIDGDETDLPPTKPTRLVRLPEVMMRVGLGRSTIYRKMEEGRFPRSRSISPKCAVWIEAEIDEWINCLIRNARH
jgi:prophage regulatory protein